MHSHGQIDLLANLDEAVEVGFGNGVLEHLDIAQRLQLMCQLDRLRSGVETLVGVDGHLEFGAGYIQHRLQAFDHRLLEHALDLDALEASLESTLHRALAVFGSLVAHPVVRPYPGANRTAQQGVNGHSARLAHQIKHRHLEGLVRRPLTDTGVMVSAVNGAAQHVLQHQRLGVPCQQLRAAGYRGFRRHSSTRFADSAQLRIGVEPDDGLGHLVPFGLRNPLRTVHPARDGGHDDGPDIDGGDIHGAARQISGCAAANSSTGLHAAIRGGQYKLIIELQRPGELLCSRTASPRRWLKLCLANWTGGLRRGHGTTERVDHEFILAHRRQGRQAKAGSR